MRVTHSYQSRAFTNYNQNAMSEIADLQSRIASGKRVLDPSDSPADAGKSIMLNQSLGQLAQYDRNTTFAESRLTMEENAVASMSNVLLSLRQLALQANNDTVGDDDRRVILQEVRTREEELYSLVNSVGPNGEYLFSGTDRTEKPFPDPASMRYEGNNSVQLVSIGLSNEITLGKSGEELMAFDSGNDQKAVFHLIDDLKVVLSAPATADRRATYHEQMEVVIAELDHAQTHVTTRRAEIGNQLSRVDSARENNSSVELMLMQELEHTEGLDLSLIHI